MQVEIGVLQMNPLTKCPISNTYCYVNYGFEKNKHAYLTPDYGPNSIFFPLHLHLPRSTKSCKRRTKRRRLAQYHQIKSNFHQWDEPLPMGCMEERGFLFGCNLENNKNSLGGRQLYTIESKMQWTDDKLLRPAMSTGNAGAHRPF